MLVNVGAWTPPQILFFSSYLYTFNPLYCTFYACGATFCLLFKFGVGVLRIVLPYQKQPVSNYSFLLVTKCDTLSHVQNVRYFRTVLVISILENTYFFFIICCVGREAMRWTANPLVHIELQRFKSSTQRSILSLI